MDASAPLAEGTILPGADSGPTLVTQPPSAELSWPVGEDARKCGNDERQQGPCPVASQQSASEKAPRDGDSHSGRVRVVARESRCPPRARGASLQDSEVAMSNGDGEMPRLLGRFAGGSGDATTRPASESVRSLVL